MTSSGRNRIFRGVAALGGLGVLGGGLGLVEFSVRQAESKDNVVFPKDAPGLKYELRPGDTENSYGYNERELSQEKPLGVRRVVVLGDSVTHGGGVAQDKVYSRATEDALHRMGRTEYQVLNFAVYGYDIESIEALAKYRISVWKPDLVVYGFYTNDAIPTELATVSGWPVWVSEGPRDFTVLSATLDPFFHEHSAFFRKLEGAAAARAIAARPETQVSQWDWYRQHFQGLTGAVKTLGVPLVTYLIPPHVFVQPSMSACDNSAGGLVKFCASNLNTLEKALAIANEAQVPVFDGGAAYREGPVTDLHRISDDPHHPNDEGHRRLGEYLARAILSLPSEAKAP